MLDKLKSKFTRNEEEPAPRYPREFIAVRWTQAARELGVGGRKNKKIVRVKNGKVKAGFSKPYHPELVKNLRDELNLPVLDETGGRESPVHDELLDYDPGVLTWNQRQLRQSEQR